MERCAQHGFLNCRCKETLSAYLARQFRESGHEYVDRGTLDQSHLRVGDLERRILDGRVLGGEAKR